MARKDYCGPYWMPAKLRRLVSSKFNASCKVHDLDYASAKYSRSAVDNRFKANVLKQSKGSSFWKIMAYIFYYMVRIGGRISYGKTDK